MQPGVASIPTVGREARHAHTGMTLIAGWRPTNDARDGACHSAGARQPYGRTQSLRSIAGRKSMSGKYVCRALSKARPTCTVHAHQPSICERFSKTFSRYDPCQMAFAGCRRSFILLEAPNIYFATWKRYYFLQSASHQPVLRYTTINKAHIAPQREIDMPARGFGCILSFLL